MHFSEQCEIGGTRIMTEGGERVDWHSACSRYCRGFHSNTRGVAARALHLSRGVEKPSGRVYKLADIFVASFEISFEEQLAMLDSVDVKVRVSKATKLVDRHLQSIRVAENIFYVSSNCLNGNNVLYKSRSFENSYIPENPRTPKPLTFSKNRLRGAKNRSNISPVAKFFFRKNDFFFPKTLHMCKIFFLHMCTIVLFCLKNAQIHEIFLNFFIGVFITHI
ncbi:hypothetical protein LXL04_027283 [Taraxacum kok-saghyz]